MPVKGSSPLRFWVVPLGLLGLLIVLGLAAAGAAPLKAGVAASLPGGGTPTPTLTVCTQGYTYTLSTGSIVSGTSLLPGSQCSACAVPVTLPFPFTFYGQTYTATNVIPQGNVQFVTTDTSNNTCPPPYAQLGPAILPAWDTILDTGQYQICQSIVGRPCGVYTSVSGTAPNRIFNIEWVARRQGSNTYIYNFELRLYESAGVFDFVYGRLVPPPSGYNSSVGVQNGAGLFTYYACNVANSIYMGLLIRWNPPACGPASTPTGTATVIATDTPTQTSTPTATFSTTITSSPTTASTSSPTFTSTSTATVTVTPCQVTFSDVHEADYFYEAVRYLYCHGVISGYGDGTFRPYNNTTRAQLAKIVVLAEGWAIYTPPSPTFVDVPANHAFYQFVETAYHHGIISGYNCGAGCLEYLPGNNVTRAQLCKIIVLARRWPTYTPPTPTFHDVPSTDPFYQYIETAYSRGIISGYSCGDTCLEFRPGNNATRGQIAKIVYLAVTTP